MHEAVIVLSPLVPRVLIGHNRNCASGLARPEAGGVSRAGMGRVAARSKSTASAIPSP